MLTTLPLDRHTARPSASGTSGGPRPEPWQRERWLARLGSWSIFCALAAVVVGYVSVFAHSLVAEGKNRVTEQAPAYQARFIRVAREASLQRRVRELPRKRKVAQALPEMPTLSLASSPSQRMTLSDLKVDLPPASTPSASFTVDLMGSPGIGRAGVKLDRQRDRDYLPFARVRPIYPLEAQSKGIEGWVELVFTVTELGSVEDVRVTRSKPRRTFNRAAMRAVRKWKYRPRISGGKPVATPGVTARIAFEMEKQ